jgi:hypothetical protein
MRGYKSVCIKRSANKSIDTGKKAHKLKRTRVMILTHVLEEAPESYRKAELGKANPTTG